MGGRSPHRVRKNCAHEPRRSCSRPVLGPRPQVRVDPQRHLLAAHPRIGDVPLEETAAIVAKGGDIAAVWASARQANDTVATITEGWAMLGQLTHLAPCDNRHRVLQMSAVDFSTWSAHSLQDRRLTPWEAVRLGLPLALPTFTEYRKRVAGREVGRQRAADQARPLDTLRSSIPGGPSGSETDPALTRRSRCPCTVTRGGKSRTARDLPPPSDLALTPGRGTPRPRFSRTAGLGGFHTWSDIHIEGIHQNPQEIAMSSMLGKKRRERSCLVPRSGLSTPSGGSPTLGSTTSRPAAQHRSDPD